jgi:beta-glucosidase
MKLLRSLLFISCICPLSLLRTSPAQLASGVPEACAKTHCPYLDSAITPEDRARDLVARMTLGEKVSQTLSHADAIPRLGVEEYDWWGEGLHGVAREGVATNFPQSIGLAATFDPALIHEIAEVIAVEGRAKYDDARRRNEHMRFASLTFWSPNVNIFRDPRWGRGQETFGEDPFLSARLGVEFVKGLQGDDPRIYRIIATPKHFAVHSGPEPARHRFDVPVSDHDMEDTYLPAFRASVVEGKAASIMCAYNAVDGKPACASDLLLKDRLRTAWGFTGFVVSDCDAVSDVFRGHRYAASDAEASAVSLRAGTDLDCGVTYKALQTAVSTGALTEAELNVTLVRLFTARIRLGMFDAPERSPYRALSMRDVDTAAADALALKAARESMVLLKNDGILPLSAFAGKIAVIGPTADLLESVEGNYNGEPSHPITPLEGMQQRFGASKVLFSPGSIVAEGTPAPIPAEYLSTGDQQDAEGLKAEFFPDASFSGKPLATRIDARINFDWNRMSPAPGVSDRDFAVRWTGQLHPPVAGDYLLSFRAIRRTSVFDPALSAFHTAPRYRVWIDGQPAFAANMDKPAFVLHAVDQKPHSIRIEYDHWSEDRFCDLEWQPPAAPLLDRAVAAARKAELTVAFVGLSPNLEGEELPVHSLEFEGGDRLDIALPRVQEHLLEAVAATGKPLIVVYTAGSALVSTTAESRARAVLMAWYPGQQGGRAIAETLTGENNPSGRLPVTFYRSVRDLPAFEEYSMANRTYRYFHGVPLYGFGFGLSYSTFRYQQPTVARQKIAAGETVEVRAKVRNTSSVAGDEVAELFGLPPEEPGSPRLALEAFERVHLGAGEEKEIVFHLDARQLSTVDVHGARAVRPGNYTVFVGGSQPTDLKPQGGVSFAIAGTSALQP